MTKWWIESQRKRKREHQLDRSLSASSHDKYSQRQRRRSLDEGFSMGPIKGREIRSYYSSVGRRSAVGRSGVYGSPFPTATVPSPAFASEASRVEAAAAAVPEDRNEEPTQGKELAVIARSVVRVDEITLDAVRTEYLALRHPVTEYDFAIALLTSGSVLFQHAHYTSAEDDDNVNDAAGVTEFSDPEDNGYTRAERRETQLKEALQYICVRVGSIQRKIENWDAAVAVLSAVISLPQKESRGSSDGPTDLGAFGRGTFQTAKQRPAKKSNRSGFHKYREILQKQLGKWKTEQRASSSKWRQISHWKIPDSSNGVPAPEVEAVEAGVAQEKRAPEDEAGGAGAIPSGDESDRFLDERIAEAERTARARIRLADEVVEAAVVEREDREAREEEARSAASSLLRPLTPEEEDIVRKAIYGLGPEDELLAKSDSGDSVQRQSMWKLKPGTWLNDEVIHYFLLMLARRDEAMCQEDPVRKRSHFFKSFFITKLLDEGGYKYKNVKRWSKKVPGKDIFNLDKIIFPVNVGGMHWTCIVAFMEDKRIQYYDSFGDSGDDFLEGIFKYIKDEHQAKKGVPLPNEDEWELAGCAADTPRQLNGFDCGVFTCMFADFVSKDCPLTFSQEHITQCRERIALSIMSGSAIH